MKDDLTGESVYCKKSYSWKFTIDIGFTGIVIRICNFYYIIDDNNAVGAVIECHKFDEYFYTIKEYRKLKLNKINESRRIYI